MRQTTVGSWAGRAIAASLVAQLSLAQTAPAWAQSDQERAGARAAATEGVQAYKSKNWTQAVDMFSRAESLMHAPTHLLYLARAEANLGHLVKAQEAYRKIMHEKLEASAPTVFREAQNDATKELRDLEPRIPMAKVVVQGGDGRPVDVKMDGASIPPALVGLPVPIDPGQHQLIALADKLASDPTTITVKEGSKETIVLMLKAAPDSGFPAVPGAPGAPPAGPAGPAAGAPPGQPGMMPVMGGSVSGSADAGTEGSSGLKIAGFVGLGVGVVGLGLGTLFALNAKSKFDDSNTQYAANNCDKGCAQQAQIQTLEDDGNSAKGISTIGFVIGGVGIVGGVTMLLLSGGKKSEVAAPAPSAPSAPAQPSAPGAPAPAPPPPFPPAPHATLYPLIGPGSVGVFGTF